MKKRLVLSAVVLLTASSAFAKVTHFSSVDAVKHVIDSRQFREAQGQLPGVNRYDLGSVEIRQSGTAPTNSFVLTFTFVPKVAPPAGITDQCVVSAETQSQIIHVGPNGGITASELTQPVVHGPSCTR